MKSFKPGDWVRAKSNHVFCGAYERPEEYRHRIWINSKLGAYIPDDDIELVPVVPFDMQRLRLGDVFGWKPGRNPYNLDLIVFRTTTYTKYLQFVGIVYRPQENGDLRLIYDHDRGGYIGNER